MQSVELITEEAAQEEASPALSLAEPRRARPRALDRRMAFVLVLL